MSGPTPPPRHPLVGRQRVLIVALRVAVVAAVVLAVLGLVVPGEPGDVASFAFVGVLVGAPLARVVWLVVRWVRRGDRRFALVGGLLLVVLGAAAVL